MLECKYFYLVTVYRNIIRNIGMYKNTFRYYKKMSILVWNIDS